MNNFKSTQKVHFKTNNISYWLLLFIIFLNCTNLSTSQILEGYSQGGIIVDGIGYFSGGTIEEPIAAFNMDTYEKIRGYRFDHIADSVPIILRRKKDNQLLILAHEAKKSRTVAMFVDDGQIAWISKPNQPNYNDFLAYSYYILKNGDTLVLTESRNGLHANSLEDGTEQWWVKRDGGMTPAVDQKDGYIYYQSNGKFDKIEGETGKVLESIQIDLPNQCISSNTILVNDIYGYYIVTYWISKEKNKPIDSSTIRVYNSKLELLWEKNKLPLSNKASLTYAKGKLFIGAGNSFISDSNLLPEWKKITAFSIINGKPIWETDLSKYDFVDVMNIIYSDNFLFAETTSGFSNYSYKIFIIDADTGKLHNDYDSNKRASSCAPPLIYDGKIFYGDLYEKRFFVTNVGFGQKKDWRGAFGDPQQHHMAASSGTISHTTQPREIYFRQKFFFPNEDQVLISNHYINILWYHSTKKKNLEFSSNNGKSWSLVKKNTDYCENKVIKYRWKIPNIRSDNCIFRLVSPKHKEIIRSKKFSIILSKKIQKNYALEFNGKSFLKIPDFKFEELSLTQFTLELWIKFAQFPKRNFQSLICKRKPGDQYANYQIWLDSRKMPGNNPLLAFTYGNGNYGSLAILYSKTHLSPNEWHHIAVTYDQNQLTIFINGEEDANLNNSALPYRTDADIFVGAYSQGDLIRSIENNFIGLIDEIRIWKKARTKKQIITNMYKPLDQKNSESIVGYWTFNEGEGTNAYDCSQYANTGNMHSPMQYIPLNPIIEKKEENVLKSFFKFIKIQTCFLLGDAIRFIN